MVCVWFVFVVVCVVLCCLLCVVCCVVVVVGCGSWCGVGRDTLKTLPCVPATGPDVLYMWTCSRYTRRRFVRTRGSVLNLHTEV